jgi:nucleoside-diphosphate-sugar epimerase
MTNNILITGGNGFLALHIIKQLLTQGKHVLATVRNPQRAAETTSTLTAAGTPHLDELEFAYLDLTQDAGWQDAMQGIDSVMSVAAPVFVNGESNAATLAKIATDGTLRILRAANAAGVRRVIMTGNFGQSVSAILTRSAPPRKPTGRIRTSLVYHCTNVPNCLLSRQHGTMFSKRMCTSN